jgi:hypothetical protein
MSQVLLPRDCRLVGQWQTNNRLLKQSFVFFPLLRRAVIVVPSACRHVAVSTAANLHGSEDFSSLHAREPHRSNCQYFHYVQLHFYLLRLA